MTRSTGEIVAALRCVTDGNGWPAVVYEAADRLTELDAEVTAWKLTARQWRMLAETGLDALLPVDPETGEPVSIEQLAATWRAVWDDDRYHPPGYDAMLWNRAIDDLRAVRP